MRHTRVPLVDEEVFCPDYHPICVQSIWFERGTAQRLTLAIWLPSGAKKKDFTFNISENGSHLEISITLPTFLSDPLQLHQHWISEISKVDYHPVILGFQKTLMEFRRRKSEEKTSTGYIELPLSVESHFQTKTKLSFMNGSYNILYLTMRCRQMKYEDEVDDIVDVNVKENVPIGEQRTKCELFLAHYLSSIWKVVKAFFYLNVDQLFL